ncbi:MAG: hypothetical protein QXT53_08695 [Ignisphaera sp.]
MKMKFLILGLVISMIALLPFATAMNYYTPAWNGNTQDIYQFQNLYYYISNYNNSEIYFNIPENSMTSITNLTITSNIEIALYNSTYNFYWYIYPSNLTNNTTSLPISWTNISFTSGSLIINVSSNNTVVYYNQQSYYSNIVYNAFYIIGQGQASWQNVQIAILPAPINQNFTILIFGLALLLIAIALIFAISRLER